VINMEKTEELGEKSSPVTFRSRESHFPVSQVTFSCFKRLIVRFLPLVLYLPRLLSQFSVRLRTGCHDFDDPVGQ
jgi:hypothetical protein